ncbi:hypothetical protein HNP10_003319 [Aeromonas veronii]|uniref:hypothetical protein n=1 Tax=Aeromonas veronii TaxID=654 RepID=UPI0017969E4F|nr:hypothetical protein [Aeromonas veronii]MCS3834520.1 hypothetical protein [Aeromonas veronii]
MEIKDLLDKLSSYNIFNHLLPGAIFCVIGTHISDIQFLQEDIVSSFFVYYFVGVIISRIGSTLVEPFLKWTRFVDFASYDKYVVASKADAKIDILSETNNMYRTLISLFISLLLLELYMVVHDYYSWISEYKDLAVFVTLLVMFSFAYKKQTKYIKARVDKNS